MRRSTKAALAVLLLTAPIAMLLATADSAAGIWEAIIGRPRRMRVERLSPTKASGLASECDPTITSPKLRAGELRLGAGDSLIVTFAGKATRCPGGTARFFTRVGDAAEVDEGSGLVAADGTWSKSITVADGARTAFAVQMTSAAGNTKRTTVYIEADTSKAVVLVDSPASDDWGFARLVAPPAALGCGGGGNPHVEAGEPGWLADASCDAGGQLAPDVTVRGAAGGTLRVLYDGQELASAAITSSPQRFTAAELGTLTLPNDTRADLVFRADAGAATAESAIGMRVYVTTPPSVQLELKLVHPRHADVDVSYVLPAIPADAKHASVVIGWTPEWKLFLGNAAGSVTVGTTPVKVPAVDPSRTSVSLTNNSTTIPVYCSPDDPAVTPETAQQTIGVKTTNPGLGGFTVVDAPCSPSRPCPLEQPRHDIWCVLAAGASSLSLSWSHDRWRALDETVWNDRTMTEKRHHCVMDDPSASPQVWTCEGRDYAPGERVTLELRWLPPLNTYHFTAVVSL